MSFNSEQKTFQKLETIIKKGQRRVVPFVGAGLSLYGRREDRLPLWGQLISLLQKRSKDYGLIDAVGEKTVSDLVLEGKHIAAIDNVIKYIGEKQFRIFIEETFDVSNKTIPPAIAELVCISWSLIVTTNMDNFIENAWRKRYTRNIEIITGRDTLRLTQAITGADTDAIPKLIKIHGTVERYETWILTGNQYELLLHNNPGYVEALKNLFLQTVFFIGYGLNDGDFDVLLSQINAIYPAGIGNYYVLLREDTKTTSHVRRLIREYGAQPIWYRYYPEKAEEPDSGYGEVLECLQLLVKAWVQTNSNAPVTLKYFPELETSFVGRNHELKIIKEHILSDNPTSLQIIGFGGEGKTSLVQQFLDEYRNDLNSSQYEAVFGCSFYRADAGRFINDAYYKLCPKPHALDISSKVSELIRIFSTQKVLLIWDGIEAIQDEDGNIKNPYLYDLLMAVLTGKSNILITSRQPTTLEIACLNLGPLTENEAIKLLYKWDIEVTNDEILYVVRDQIGLHALSLRILAGFVRYQGDSAIELLRQLSITSIPDEADPLRANKANRILEYYQSHLSEELLAFMKCFSIFQRPVAASVVVSCLSKPLPDCSLNKSLIGKDLRTTIRELINRRLLMVESGSLLTIHPLVRNYFRGLVNPQMTRPLHQELVSYYQSILKDDSVYTFDRALVYFDLCYHAVSSGQWDLFHYIFNSILNQNHKNYLGYVLAAWQEYLDLASLAFPESDYRKVPLVKPIYYLATTARGLKHLGRSGESKNQYLRCIDLCAKSKHPDTARYINNLFTLSIAMGSLDTAAQLILLNFATLKWMKAEWQRRWQTEHAFNSIGYLAGLLGKLELAEKYCDYADHVWDDFSEQKQWFYYYHRIYLGDIILGMTHGREKEVLNITNENVQIGEKYGWKETIALAHRCLCSTYRVMYSSGNDTTDYISMAESHLNNAMRIAEEVAAPRLEIEVLIERIRLQILSYKREEKRKIDINTLSRIISRADHLIKQCSFFLYEPELLAARGWLSKFSRDEHKAKRYCSSAVEMAKRTRHELAIASRSGLLKPLMELYNIEPSEPMQVNISKLPSIDHLLSLEITSEELRTVMSTMYAI